MKVKIHVHVSWHLVLTNLTMCILQCAVLASQMSFPASGSLKLYSKTLTVDMVFKWKRNAIRLKQW